MTLADGHPHPARVLATDGTGDLAALAVATGGLPAMAHRAAWRLRPRHWVRALGHPWGSTGAATTGMVIDVSPPPELPHWRGEFIQVGMHLRPGYSGGPLVDGHGCLVGINTIMAGPEMAQAESLPAPRRC